MIIFKVKTAVSGTEQIYAKFGNVLYFVTHHTYTMKQMFYIKICITTAASTMKFSILFVRSSSLHCFLLPCFLLKG